MRACQKHWDLFRETIQEHGLDHLVSKSSEEAIEKVKKETEGVRLEERFDPLISINNFFMEQALKNGGLSVMRMDNTENDGHHCPVCLFEKNMKGFVAQREISEIIGQMLKYCKEKGLVKVS